ncbi:hypothetical protein K435DRAFT_372290 [Dendrothele bispora CBS 962.96]|uniref:Uncharacterized protein n=1 Tax=Dendrothele bispora (strain CBS 962.96) TaxID=1314807 RepID=A0A4S8MH10_DENBC|nr:hypothetical protein K435DRAFT_372290 [Dendrothele bispora CBS 962.96]
MLRNSTSKQLLRSYLFMLLRKFASLCVLSSHGRPKTASLISTTFTIIWSSFCMLRQCNGGTRHSGHQTRSFFGPADDDDNNEPALDSDMASFSEHFQNYVDSDDKDGNFSSGGQTSSSRQILAPSTVPSLNSSTAQDQENRNHDVNDSTSRSTIEDPMALDRTSN